MRLKRDLHIVEVQLLKHTYVLHGGFDQCFCRYAAVLRENLVIERTGVNADTDGDSSLTCCRNDLLDALRPADVARVDAQCRNALRHRLKGKLVVEVDVGDERRLDLPHNIAEIFRCLHIGYGNAYNVTARRRKFTDLLNGRLRVRRLRIAHGLHGDRSTSPNGDRSNVNLPCAASFIVCHSAVQPPAKMRITSFFIASSMSKTMSPTPAF